MLKSFPFLLREGCVNVRRHGLLSFTALCTITVALTILGASLWTAYRVTEIADQQPQKFNSIDVFLRVDATREQTNALAESLRNTHGVAAVQVITKEAAWASYEKNDPSLTRAMPDNPLMDRLVVQAGSSADVGVLASRLRDKKLYPSVMQVNDANQEVRVLLRFARLVKVLGVAISVGLFLATLFVVQNTIRLTVFARRREIRIMQLVGATAGFIRLPLLLEGVFHGLFGGLLSAAFLLFMASKVSSFVAALHSPLIGSAQSQVTPWMVLAALALAGVLTGLSGSYVSVRRYLRQP